MNESVGLTFDEATVLQQGILDEATALQRGILEVLERIYDVGYYGLHLLIAFVIAYFVIKGVFEVWNHS